MVDIDEVKVGDTIWLLRPQRGDYHKAKVTELSYIAGKYLLGAPVAIIVEYPKRENKTVRQRISIITSTDRFIDEVVRNNKKPFREIKSITQTCVFSNCIDMLKFADKYCKNQNKSLKEEIQASKSWRSSEWI